MKSNSSWGQRPHQVLCVDDRPSGTRFVSDSGPVSTPSPSPWGGRGGGPGSRVHGAAPQHHPRSGRDLGLGSGTSRCQVGVGSVLPVGRDAEAAGHALSWEGPQHSPEAPPGTDPSTWGTLCWIPQIPKEGDPRTPSLLVMGMSAQGSEGGMQQAQVTRPGSFLLVNCPNRGGEPASGNLGEGRCLR